MRTVLSCSCVYYRSPAVARLISTIHTYQLACKCLTCSHKYTHAFIVCLNIMIFALLSVVSDLPPPPPPRYLVSLGLFILHKNCLQTMNMLGSRILFWEANCTIIINFRYVWLL